MMYLFVYYVMSMDHIYDMCLYFTYSHNVVGYMPHYMY